MSIENDLKRIADALEALVNKPVFPVNEPSGPTALFSAQQVIQQPVQPPAPQPEVVKVVNDGPRLTNPESTLSMNAYVTAVNTKYPELGIDLVEIIKQHGGRLSTIPLDQHNEVRRKVDDLLRLNGKD